MKKMPSGKDSMKRMNKRGLENRKKKQRGKDRIERMKRRNKSG